MRTNIMVGDKKNYNYADDKNALGVFLAVKLASGCPAPFLYPYIGYQGKLSIGEDALNLVGSTDACSKCTKARKTDDFCYSGLEGFYASGDGYPWVGINTKDGCSWVYTSFGYTDPNFSSFSGSSRICFNLRDSTAGDSRFARSASALGGSLLCNTATGYAADGFTAFATKSEMLEHIRSQY